MRQPATRLDIPGYPTLLHEREGEPVLSRFTGKPLRQIRWILEAYGDNAHEQLNTVLTAAASTDGELISYGQGGQWAVTSHNFSYQAGQAMTVYRHEVELAEHENLRLERVEFEGLDIIPDRWKLESDDARIWLAFLVNLDPGQHQQLERVLEQRTAEEAEQYFSVQIVGITASPIKMRFGRCLWQRLDERTVRHRIWLVGEGGDDQASGVFDSLNQPELSRTIDQSLILRIKLDILISELQHAGVLNAEAIERISNVDTIDDISFADARELDRTINIERFLD